MVEQAGTTNINGKFTTGIILKTNNMQINIIEQISNSCSCSHMEAQEYLDSEIRYLRELQEADDLRKMTSKWRAATSDLTLTTRNILSTASQGH